MLVAVFVVVTGLVVAGLSEPTEEYRPGEEIEGLTASLARDLPEDYPRVTFADVTVDAGIHWQHFPGVRSSQLPEDMGSGAAWGDYDADGWPDLFLVNIARPLTGPAPPASESDAPPAGSALYRNLGDGTFADVTAIVGIEHSTAGMGAAWQDYDRDGHLDLFVTAYGRNALYRNDGDGTFSDQSAQAGVGGLAGFWTGAAWGDYDRDGDPDLYVTGYVRYSPGANVGVTVSQYEVAVPASLNPSSYRAERNLLYRNDGDGTFTEVAEAAGVGDDNGRGLSAVWVDFDADGWLDLYVANDVSDNALLRNKGDGTFENVSLAALVADYRGAMGLGVGDWDADGDVDLFITHWIAQENALFSNRLADGPTGSLQFLDEADRYGLGQIALDYIGWGTSFFDYDNDGWLDLFVANGSTFQLEDDPVLLEPMADQLFWNRGREHGFFDVSSVGGVHFGQAAVGRGAAFADYDHDGDVDVVIVNHSGAPALLRNEGEDRGAWLEIVLAGDPVGAQVRLVAGGHEQRRWLGAQGSYLSQNSPVLHFGLGDQAAADTVEVTWPGGPTDVWIDVATGQAIRLSPGQPSFDQAWSAQTSISSSDPAVGALLDERERTRRFWERYREATRHRTSGDAQAALAAYEDAYRLNPEHEDVLYYLSSTRADLGDHGGAVQLLERLLALNPRSTRGLVRMGALMTCPVEGTPPDLPAARQAFVAAEAINPEQIGPALWLGVVALLDDDRDVAALHLDQALGSDPENVAGLILRGLLHWRAGQPEAARATLGRVPPATAETSEELGLQEGDTRGPRRLFAAAQSCTWLEDTLVGFLDRLNESGAKASGVAETEAFSWLDSRLASAGK